MIQTKLISQGDADYPSQITQRLKSDAPKVISVAGSAAILTTPMTAFLCSKETPGATILKAFDQTAAWRDAGVCVISGFHSPLEQQCLDILLRGKQPIVMALARGLGTLRLPAPQRKAFDEGRLTVISQFPESETRTTKETARQRNRLIAALADEVVVAYVAPGGSLEMQLAELQSWGQRFQILFSES